MRFKEINGIVVPIAKPTCPRATVGYMFTIDPDGTVGNIVHAGNTMMYEGADILGNLVGGEAGYNIDTMYIEYQNNPGGAVATPTVTRAAGRDYYAGLGSSGRDFLRVPLITSPLIEGSDSNYTANQVTFFAITTGDEGVHGIDFDAASNSTVFGAALVASPNWNDWTEDLVYSRWYYQGTNQIAKTAGQQIGITRTINFL